MRTRLLLSLTLFIATLNSSFAQHINYEDDNGWNLGFNIGGVWQEPENKAVSKAGISGGLTLGKSIYEKEGAFFSFDLRFRYLGGWNKGWDTDTSTINLTSDTIIGYKNYRLRVHEYTLEGVLTLNRLRERTGIILYGFGGVGLTDYAVKSNYYNDYGSVYNFSSIDNTASSSQIVSELKRLTDNSYETVTKETAVDFMPSVGFGIGYQFSQHFSMGVEHKITYALHDNLDGMVNGVNDKYHYSAGYFRWNLFGSGGTTYTVDDNTNTNNQVTNYTTVPANTTTPTGNKPLVNIVNPATNNQIVQNSNLTINANIYYVASHDKVIFKQNGIQLSNFNFNPSSNQFNASVILQPGNNVFEIIGSNPYGTDQDSKIVILQNQIQVTPPPIVTITNPSSCPFTTESKQFAVTSTILNVDNANQITYKFNGSPSANFSYNTSTKIFSSNVNLNSGNNTIEITATNKKGSVTKTCTINYVPKVKLPPVVTITYPTANPFNTTNSLTNINGTVIRVASKNQISVLVNGSNLTNFTYDFNTKKIAFPANLIIGTNVILITATNFAGSDSKSTTIIYTKPLQLPPPVVTFVNPAVSPHTTPTNNFNVEATVLNVNGKPGISVKHNGAPVTNFSFNPITKLVHYNANLIIGSNVFEIKGTNLVGNDVEVATVIYRKPTVILPPVVTITNPSANPFNTTSPTETINATILNVNNANNVTATFNGLPVSNFVFNPSTDLFNFSGNLVIGANTLLITGTNLAGTASKTQTIIYSIPECENPTLALKSPSANPHVTTNSKGSLEYDIVGASSVVFKVNGQVSPGYTFNSLSGKFTSLLHLTEGATTYEVIATNNCGSTSQTNTIIYEHEIPCYDPVLSFTNPNTNPFEYIGKRGNTSFSANAMNVSNKNMIDVKLNNASIPFTFNAASGNVSGAITLIKGNNTISISATNECGNTSIQTVIVFAGIQNQLPPPIVTITTPNTNPFTTNSQNQIIKATILNVRGANSISAIYNGVPVTNFTYNVSSKIFSYNANLVDGINSLVISGTNAVGTDSKTQTINYTLPCSDPTINFVKPTLTTSASSSFFATVLNVTNQNMIVVKHNNSSIPFTFNANNGLVSVQLTLSEGNNTVSITATNACGSDNTSHNITYTTPVEETPCENPVINITTSSTSSAAAYSLVGSISNITNASNVVVKLNGNTVSSNYNVNSKNLSAALTLNEGNNTIIIQANECDGVSQTLNVNYTIPCDPVSYNLILPNGNSAISAAATYMIKINTSNVPSNANISVSLNGNSIPFTFNTNSGMINCANIPLQDGNNAVIVTIGNDCSNETISFNISYSAPVEETPCENPVISINSASRSSNSAYNLTGSISNITNTSNVVVKLNGNTVSSNYNVNSKNLSAALTLNEGNNTIIIQANECDGVSQTLNVNYTIPCDPVSYNLILPNGNSAISAAATYMIKINTSNVPSNANISVSLNGNSIPFTFNTNSGMINCANIPLQDGNNAVIVTIGNDCSNETISFNISYSAPVEEVPCENPVINITSASTSSTANYNLVGNISNITNANYINVKLNGNTVSSSFNVNNGNLSASLSLNVGANVVIIEAEECDGDDISFEVNYTVPCDPVSYNLILPNGNSATSAAATYMIKINTSNVPSNANISVSLNGNSIPFTFNANSGMINCANIPLQDGNNAVIVTIGNACSNETISYNISYTVPVDSGNGNNGHGNNEDGVDSSNPGQGNGGPNGETDESGEIDDEGQNGNQDSENGNSGNGNNGHGNDNSGNSGNGNHASESATNSQYTSAIKKADMYYNVKKWATAKTYYQNALQLKPNEKYPKNRIAEIDAKLSGKSMNTNSTNTTNTNNVNKVDPVKAKYDVAIQKADMYYNAKKWATAKTYYQNASQLKPNEQYPKNRIKAIEIKMKATNTVKPNNTKVNPTNKTNTRPPVGGNKTNTGAKTTTGGTKTESTKKEESTEKPATKPVVKPTVTPTTKPVVKPTTTGGSRTPGGR